MKYYRIEFEIEDDGLYENPHTVYVKNEESLEYMKPKDNYENQIEYFEKFPTRSIGTLFERRKYTDFMVAAPWCFGLEAAVNKRIKGIFEELNISKKEYYLKKIDIKKIHEDFFLLFIPLIREEDYYFPECRFNDFNSEEDIFFKNNEEFQKDDRLLNCKHIALNNKYKDCDFLNLRYGFFVSERIINKFQEMKITGWELSKRPSISFY